MSVLDGGKWSASCCSHFTPREREPSTIWQVVEYIQSWSRNWGTEESLPLLLPLIKLLFPTYAACSPVTVLTVFCNSKKFIKLL
jgi:hypothetical protein